MTRPRSFSILVVEDDPLLLMDAVDMFEDEGFVVHPARNADQAIRHLEAHQDIRILFTDIDMPGSMDGLCLAYAVRDRWPPVRIMVTSGLKGVDRNEMPLDSLFFAKPYPSKDVVRAVSRVASELLE